MFYKEKKVLVTGGSGFIGINLVQELLKQDARIRIPLHKRRFPIQDERIEFVQADLFKAEDCVRVSKDVQYVFHAAGSVASALLTKENPMDAIVTNLILTARMLQGAWASGVERFLVFSSSTGYPDFLYPVKEEDFWKSDPHPAYFGYGWMRRYLELISQFVTTKSKMKITIVRPTAVYGPWDNFDLNTCHVIPALIRKAVERSLPYLVWGSGEEERDFLHVRDLAKGCLLALEKYPTCEPFNIGYGKSVTIKDIVPIILKAAGYSDAQVIFDASKPTTIPFRAVNISKAETLLNYRPQISIDDGLNDTVNWYLKQRLVSVP